METNGSPMPEYETDEERTYFISRLYIRDGFYDEDDAVLKESLVSNTNQAANQAKSRNELSPLEMRIVELVNENPYLTQREIADKTNEKYSKVKFYMEQLKRRIP